MDQIQAKKKLWSEKLAKLETQYQEIMVRRSEAIAMGDLSENAAYSMANEDAAACSAQIDDVNKILAKLEKDGHSK